MENRRKPHDFDSSQKSIGGQLRFFHRKPAGAADLERKKSKCAVDRTDCMADPKSFFRSFNRVQQNGCPNCNHRSRRNSLGNRTGDLSCFSGKKHQRTLRRADHGFCSGTERKLQSFDYLSIALSLAVSRKQSWFHHPVSDRLHAIRERSESTGLPNEKAIGKPRIRLDQWQNLADPQHPAGNEHVSDFDSWRTGRISFRRRLHARFTLHFTHPASTAGFRRSRPDTPKAFYPFTHESSASSRPEREDRSALSWQ